MLDMARKKNKSLVAVDPGLITGVATLSQNPNGKLFNTVELPAMEAVSWIENYIQKGQNMSEIHVVCEAFTINDHTAKETRQYDALEVIGAVRYLCEVYNLEFHTPVKPSVRKVISSELLQDIGWYRSSPDKHMIDATKHVVAFGLRMGILKPEILKGDYVSVRGFGTGWRPNHE
jgi:hypothetical protein